MPILLFILLALSCQVEQDEPQTSEEKSALLKITSKTVIKAANEMLPTIKGAVKRGVKSGDFSDLNTMLKAGGTKGKAATRAFKMLVEHPIIVLDETIKGIKRLPDTNPLAAKANKIEMEKLDLVIDELAEAANSHHQALKGLKGGGLNVNKLRVKINSRQLRKWKKSLKKDYPDQFKQLSSLQMGVDYTNDGLAAAAGITLPLSVHEFMTQEDF